MREAETMSTEVATENSEPKEEYASFVGRIFLFIPLSLTGIALLSRVAAILGSANITSVEICSVILAPAILPVNAFLGFTFFICPFLGRGKYYW
jgi:hypothetical protein